MLENFYGYLAFYLLVGIQVGILLIVYRHYYRRKKRKHQKRNDHMIDKEW